MGGLGIFSKAGALARSAARGSLLVEIDGKQATLMFGRDRADAVALASRYREALVGADVRQLGNVVVAWRHPADDAELAAVEACLKPARTAAQLAAARQAAQAARARARQRAAAHAAAVAAANEWHRGYRVYSPTDGTAWRWINGSGQYANDCGADALYGCWRIEVITRDGCPNYVAADGNEYQNGAIVNSLLDNNGNGVPPQTPIRFEWDADADQVTAADVKITCD